MSQRSVRFGATLVALSLVACGESTKPPGPNPTDKPEITSFVAQSARVAKGAKATLNYVVTKATSVTITDGQGNKLLDASANLTGTVESQALMADTTFTLSATNDAGTTTKNLTVTVDANGVAVVRFEALPSTVQLGDTTRISWSTANANHVTITSGGNTLVDVTGSSANMGTLTATITEEMTSFHLEAKNDMASATRDLTVVGLPPLEIKQFRARPQTFSGASAMISLTWVVEGAQTIALTANGTAVPGVPMTGTATVSVQATGTTRFELIATSPDGQMARATQVAAQASQEMEPNDALDEATALTGSAVQGTLSSDTDVDSYTFMVPAGGNVFLETSDGMGGCPADLNTQLELFDPDGLTLGVLNGGGAGGCDKGDPTQIPELTNLPAGIYTVQVGVRTGSGGAYTLIVLVQAPACGNSIPESLAGEQCDDANTTAGDGCDASCHVETQGSVSGPPGDMSFNVNLMANQARSIEINLSGPGYIFAETTGPSGPCDDMTDTVLELLDNNGVQLTSNDDKSGATDYCSQIDPARDVDARVDAGRYILTLHGYHGMPLNNITLRVRIFGMGCGNGIPEMGEGCDDGNTTNGDTCSSTCQREIDQTFMGTGGHANVSFTAPDQVRTFAVVIGAPGQSITATVSPPAGQMDCQEIDITLTGTAGRELGGRTGFTMCPGIKPNLDAWARDLVPGTYHIELVMTGTGAAQLDVGIISPRCGNGLLETRASEICDDNNTAAGDGCTPQCRYDASVFQEVEPNDVAGMANALTTPRGSTLVVAGGLVPGTDVDNFAFTVPAGQRYALTAQTYGLFGNRNNCAADTILELQDTMGRVLARNDDRDTGELCSEISMTTTGTSAEMLGPGRYILQVTSYNEVARPAYFLDVHLQ